MPHEHLRFQHLDCLQGNADHDDDGGTADGQGRYVHDSADQQGQDRHDAQVDGAEQRDLVEDLLDEVRGRLARAEAGIKPPFFFRLLEISTGLNWMVA